jgi:hypothetical protein
MSVVIDGRISPADDTHVVLYQPNDSKRRVSARIKELTFERDQASPQYVGFGRAEVLRQPVETRSIVAGEEHLNGCRLRSAPRAPPLLMIARHES